MLTSEQLAAIKARCEAEERWNLVRPGGPQGPFWGIVSSTGRIIALQIVGEADARQMIGARADISALLAECERLREEKAALSAEKAASIGRYQWMFPCSKCGRSEYTSHAFMVDGFLLCAHCAVDDARKDNV